MRLAPYLVALLGFVKLNPFGSEGEEKTPTTPQEGQPLLPLPITNIPALLSDLIGSFQWSCPLSLTPKGGNSLSPGPLCVKILAKGGA